jgi:hypothetical protein
MNAAVTGGIKANAMPGVSAKVAKRSQGVAVRPVSAIVCHACEITERLGEAWLARVYREQILTLRTRAYRLATTVPAKASNVLVQHTLLGVELKIGRRRLMCPDLATARYLAVFARMGCAEVALPYDITRISLLADELESAWHRMLLLIEHVAEKLSPAYRSRLRARLVRDARQEIEEAGAGAAIPQFNQNTRQRRA